jgi:hypothetical protein
VTWRLGLLVVLAVGVGLAWVRSCSGPDPVVESTRLIEPSAEGAPYRVEAVVRNRGPGEGQAELTVRLRDRESGRTVEDDKKLQLERGETTLAVVEIKAPRGSYDPQVEASYPPR